MPKRVQGRKAAVPGCGSREFLQELEAEGADYLAETPEELIQVVLGRG